MSEFKHGLAALAPGAQVAWIDKGTQQLAERNKLLESELARLRRALEAIAELHIPEVRNDYQGIARRALAEQNGDG